MQNTMQSLSFDQYYDRILGTWIGKSIGGIVGARFEGHKILGDVATEDLWPDEHVPNDDLDIQIVWLEMLEEHGCEFTHDDLARFWQDRCHYNFSEYGYFLLNVQRGIHPPLSGAFNNAFFCRSMGCPIRAEIWGCVSPGNPDLAAGMARMDGELDHIEDSVWAEQFWAAAVSSAFLSDSLGDALSAGLKVVPPHSEVAHLFDRVSKMCSKHSDWRRIWRELVRRYGDRDCSKGLLNFGFTLLSLYAGQNDIKQIITIAVNCGWDVDCTAATAGALTGALHGAKRIPPDWIEQVGERLTCGIDVRHKNATLHELAMDTCKAGLEMSLTRNKAVRIVNVPEEIMDEVQARFEQRPSSSPLSFQVRYKEEPVLSAVNPCGAELELCNTSQEYITGELEIKAPDDLDVFSETTQVQLQPGESFRADITAGRCNNTNDVIWDLNLLDAIFCDINDNEYSYSFGFAGARQWRVYGPYWEIYDTHLHDACPYRNNGFATHPKNVDRGIFYCFHQEARIDRLFLDEQRLLKEDIPEEMPFLVERGEDYIDSVHLGGYTGEAVYYLVREVIASVPLMANMTIGATMPFVAWIDGEEVLRSDTVTSWYPGDHTHRVDFGKTKKRIVVKCACQSDTWRFSLEFRRSSPSNRPFKGVSFIEDRLGDVRPNATVHEWEALKL